MNETKRVHSIARKLGNSWTLRTIAIMLSLDILLLLLLGAGLIYYHETAALGSQWEPGLTRELSPYVTLDSLSYRFRLDPGEWHNVPLRPIVEAILPFAGIQFA